MRLLGTSLALLVSAWLIHLVVWRIKLPRRQIPALLAIFAAVFAGWLVWAIRSGPDWPETCHIGLFYISAALCYVITYSAIEGDSPTLSLMRAVAAKEPHGLSEADLDRFVAARPFVAARLDALLASGLVERREGRIFRRGAPSLFFRLILAFRKLYGPIDRGG